MRAIAAAFLLALVLLASSGQAQAQWAPRNVYRIDCGAATNSSVDGLIWQPDEGRFASSGQVSNASSNSSSAPYSSARIFDSSASYNFPVAPGRHWIRLHFLALSSMDRSKCRFSVSIGSHLLLSNFTGDSSARVHEFSIPAASTTLSIVLDPSPDSLAFVNGIEVVSMAHDAISGGAAVTRVSSGDGEVAAPPLDVATTAMQTMYRVNVGGATVAPANDSASQGRTWTADEDFLTGVVRGATTPSEVDQVRYPSMVPEYVAPRAVYGTARTLGPGQTVVNLVNLSWSFDVDPGFQYYVRLHFAELVFTEPLERIFNVYINNQTAIRALDLIQQVQEQYTAYFKDFALGPLESSVRIQIGPTPSAGSSTKDAILNGLEIFKLNDTLGNIGGPAAASGNDGNGRSHKKPAAWIMGAAIGVGAAAALGFAIVAAFCCCRSDKKKPQGTVWQPLSAAAGNSHSILASTVGGSPKSTAGSYFGSVAGGASNGRYFTFQELVEATQGFDESRILGTGGFGHVYKAELDGGTLEVAVKRANPRSEQGQAEFQAEIELLSKLRHRHLVSLIGYCDEQDEMILVYEYMALGPLRGHLYGSNGSNNPRPIRLTWRQRLDICVAAARGLHYLHTGADHSRAVIHRDVKTTNILLDEQLVAKVSDFGLSKTGPMLDQTHVSTIVKGSFGYLDPEYYRRQQLTEKSDVYSFGVVLIEVICARPAIDATLPQKQVNIVEWALEAKRRGHFNDIMDPRLHGDADAASLAKVVEIAEKCLAEQGVDRPSMGHVLQSLEAALHMQEAAQQRRAAAQSGVEGGNVEMVAARSNAAAPDPAAAAAAAPPPAAPPAVAPPAAVAPATHHPEEDDYDGYSEDTSTSEVFSQLVHPRGR